MQVYEKDPSYLVNYEVRDNKILQHYYKDEKEHPIPNIPHNIEACDRQLMRQFQTYKNADYNDDKMIKNLSISKLVISGLMIATIAITSQEPILYALAGYYHARDVFDIIKSHKKIKHFELTDFCLHHALEIKELSQNLSFRSVLSEKAQEAFIQDQGFTLNQSEKYSVKDLKQLQKAINSK